MEFPLVIPLICCQRALCSVRPVAGAVRWPRLQSEFPRAPSVLLRTRPEVGQLCAQSHGLDHEDPHCTVLVLGDRNPTQFALSNKGLYLLTWEQG